MDRSTIIVKSSEREIELPPELQPDERRSSPFLTISQLLWQRRRQVGRMTLAGLLLATVIAWLIPNSYEATVQLMPPDSSSGSAMAALAGLMGKSGLMGGSLIGDMLGGLGQQNLGAVFVGVMRSRTVEDRIINRFDLRKVYWRKKYVDTREKLEARTDIKEDRKTGIIEISVSDRDRKRATAMAQAYVDELNRLVAQVSNSAARKERIFLENRLVVVDNELKQAAKNLSEFSSKNATLDPKDQGRAIVESAAVLQGQLIAEQSELSGLEQIYTPDNVRVRALRSRVAELQDQLGKIAGKDYAGTTTLDANSLYPSLRQLPVLGLQYAEMYRRVKIDETVFEILTQEYEMAKIQEAKDTPSVKVLDAPQLPEKKSSPSRWLIIFLGAFTGLLLSSCWIVGTQLWSEVDPSQPHKAFLTQVWADTQPVVQKSITQVKGRFTAHRNGHDNGSSPRDLR